MELDLKLFTAFHKEFYIPPVDFVVPIWVGRQGRDISGDMPGDDTGDNMSHLNSKYCELTLLYWIWKNKTFNDSEVWGLCHYRRYFAYQRWYSFRRYIISDVAEKTVIDGYVNETLKRVINKKMQKADVILPYPLDFSYRQKNKMTIEEQFKAEHVSSDWEVAKEVLLEKYPEYASSFEKFRKQSKISIANMMIARASVWRGYLSWIFDISLEVDKRIPEKDNAYQRRIHGFISERFLNLYVQHNKLKTDYMRLVVFNKEKASSDKG